MIGLPAPDSVASRENKVNKPADDIVPAGHELEQACQRWLDARKSFKSAEGKATWGAYMQADHMLLSALARDLSALDDRSLALSFRSLRQALALSPEAPQITSISPQHPSSKSNH